MWVGVKIAISEKWSLRHVVWTRRLGQCQPSKFKKEKATASHHNNTRYIIISLQNNGIHCARRGTRHDSVRPPRLCSSTCSALRVPSPRSCGIRRSLPLYWSRNHRHTPTALCRPFVLTFRREIRG